jgi:hypothetical protein
VEPKKTKPEEAVTHADTDDEMEESGVETGGNAKTSDNKVAKGQSQIVILEETMTINNFIMTEVCIDGEWHIFTTIKSREPITSDNKF